MQRKRSRSLKRVLSLFLAVIMATSFLTLTAIADSEPPEATTMPIQWFIYCGGQILEYGDTKDSGNNSWTPCLYTNDITVDNASMQTAYNSFYMETYEHGGLIGSDNTDASAVSSAIKAAAGTYSEYPGDQYFMDIISEQNAEITSLQGNTVNLAYLDTDHYDIQWYVMKDINGSIYHVDGVLSEIPKTPVTIDIKWAIHSGGNVLESTAGTASGGTWSPFLYQSTITVNSLAWMTQEPYKSFYMESNNLGGLISNSLTDASGVSAAIEACAAAYSTMPNEATMLAEVKNWMQANPSMTVKTAQGNDVDVDNLDSSHYEFQWYVMKSVASDYGAYHVDGVLVNKDSNSNPNADWHNINWFISLKGVIRDVTSIDQNPVDLFTSQLAPTGANRINVQCDEWALRWPDYYTTDGSAVPGVGGLASNSDSTAESVDAAIRALMTDYVDTYPGDANIRAAIKAWLTNERDTDRHVYTIYDRNVDADLLTALDTTCYVPQWYVLKTATAETEETNLWHIDGVLVEQFNDDDPYVVTLQYKLTDDSAVPSDRVLPYNGELVYYHIGSPVKVGLNELTNTYYPTEQITTDDGVYTFSGWYVDENLTTQAEDFNIAADTILYGKWTYVPNVCHISYEITGGEAPTGSEAPEMASVAYNGNYTVEPVLTTTQTTNDAGVPGTWTFDGWYEENGEEPVTELTNVTEDKTLYGSWTFAPETYTITYQVTGDIPDDYVTPDDATVNYGDDYTVAAVPANQNGEKNGVQGMYTFSGWYLDDNPVTELTNVTENKQLTGEWRFEAANHTVSYEFVPDEPVPPDCVLPEPDIVAHEADYTVRNGFEPSEGTLNGVPGTWSFNGWWLKDDVERYLVTYLTRVITDMILQGSFTFTPATYTVKYEVDGVIPEGWTDTPEDDTVVYGGSHKVTDVFNNIRGNLNGVNGTYTFAGWYTDTDRTEPVETDDNGCLTVRDDITLYGRWSFIADTEDGENENVPPDDPDGDPNDGPDGDPNDGPDGDPNDGPDGDPNDDSDNGPDGGPDGGPNDDSDNGPDGGPDGGPNDDSDNGQDNGSNNDTDDNDNNDDAIGNKPETDPVNPDPRTDSDLENTSETETNNDEPKMGDSLTVWLWLSCISGAALIACIMFRKRKDDKVK